MTKFGIIGMGKMGNAITALLEADQDHTYHAFSRLSAEKEADLKACDVAIEFTTPEAAPGIIRHCLASGVPIVSGTTGWQEYHLENIKNECKNLNGRFLFASNFSIGMNLTFAINRKLASIIASFPQFKPSILEKHHIHKKDAPSGTAYSLLNDIIERHPVYNGFEMTPVQGDKNKIPVTAIREGEIKGYHEITWSSGLENIRISHEAFDRKIFAEGAIHAASWLKDQKPGVYTMTDIIGL